MLLQELPPLSFIFGFPLLLIWFVSLVFVLGMFFSKLVFSDVPLLQSKSARSAWGAVLAAFVVTGGLIVVLLSLG
jgi:hypothetical protein